MDLIEAIRQYASKELKDEIEYKLGVQRDEIYLDPEWGEQLDLMLAFDDVFNQAEDWGHKPLTKECITIAIAIGVYKEVLDKDYKNTTVVGHGGKRAAYPKINGKYYTFDKHLEPYFVDLDFVL